MIREMGVVLGWWLISQGFIIPAMLAMDDLKISIITDFGALALLYVLYFGLKLLGVDFTF